MSRDLLEAHLRMLSTLPKRKHEQRFVRQRHEKTGCRRGRPKKS